MTHTDDWKHGTHFHTLTEPDAIAVFDDEFHDQDTLYKRHGTRFIPCRSVAKDTKHAPTHWHDVLSAWSLTAPLEDHRNDRTNPLP